MRYAVIVFPGSNCDYDTLFSVNSNSSSGKLIFWHQKEELGNIDCVIIPGGFSYGDYLRTGSIAALSPIIKPIKQFAEKGGLVLGICNGFQVLLETGLLPGALIRNKNTRFICKHVFIKTINNKTPFTRKIPLNSTLNMPIAHMDGNYFCSSDKSKELEDNEQIIFKYSNKLGAISEKTNINGSFGSIAGIANKKKNILGLMPHPERATDILLGSTDGRYIFSSIENAVKELLL